jgi:hypothetical protein
MVVSMTLKELEKMAQETAAFGVHPSGEYIYSFYTEQLQAFAKLVAEHEREACAKVCDDWSNWHGDAKIISKAIRARGKA